MWKIIVFVVALGVLAIYSMPSGHTVVPTMHCFKPKDHNMACFTTESRQQDCHRSGFTKCEFIEGAVPGSPDKSEWAFSDFDWTKFVVGSVILAVIAFVLNGIVWFFTPQEVPAQSITEEKDKQDRRIKGEKIQAENEEIKRHKKEAQIEQKKKAEAGRVAQVEAEAAAKNSAMSSFDKLCAEAGLAQNCFNKIKWDADGRLTEVIAVNAQGAALAVFNSGADTWMGSLKEASASVVDGRLEVKVADAVYREKHVAERQPQLAMHDLSIEDMDPLANHVGASRSSNKIKQLYSSNNDLSNLDLFSYDQITRSFSITPKGQELIYSSIQREIDTANFSALNLGIANKIVLENYSDNGLSETTENNLLLLSLTEAFAVNDRRVSC